MDTPPLSYANPTTNSDLVSQIIANATVAFPAVRLRAFGNKELRIPHCVVAKTPSYQVESLEIKQVNQIPDADPDEASTSKPPQKPSIPNPFKLSGKEDKAKIDMAKAAQATTARAVQEAAAALPPGAYYALLVRPEFEPPEYIVSKGISILLRGELRDTAVEALEHLLELTRDMIHQAVIQADIRAEE